MLNTKRITQRIPSYSYKICRMAWRKKIYTASSGFDLIKLPCSIIEISPGKFIDWHTNYLMTMYEEYHGLFNYSKQLMYLPPTTVIKKVADAVFPLGSENVYVTSVSPIGKKAPGFCDREIKLTTPELSSAVHS